MKPIATFIAIALFAALFATGCGGGGAQPQSSSNAKEDLPPSKAEFIEQGDKICEKADKQRYTEGRIYNERHEKELNRLEPVPREEKLIRIIGLPLVMAEAKALEDLRPPKGDEKQIASFIAAIRAATVKARKDPYATEGEIGYGENPFRAIDFRLREYGFQVCRSIH